jgi:eukaryotic-like serine/threonine-protein kinase
VNGTNERYRLVRPLAAGGMAELFLGVARGAEGFEKPVAIKRVLPHLAREPSIAQMFLAEAKLATHLQHQNIASVYDVGNGPGGLFLVMELVNGWDLSVLLRRAFRQGRRFPPHLVAFIGAQVLAGLVHAYRRLHAGRPVMTAHRDISPSNILVSREGEVKVTDFGIARLEGVSMGTQPGTFKGKIPYAAPETLRGRPATAASDQFSLGIVLYELLTGQHPFATDNEEPLSFVHSIPQNEPSPLPREVPAPLVAVVMRALAKAPEARFPRPEDMADALARYLSQSGEPATSQALADFLAHLNLPPTLLELGEQTEQQELAPTGVEQPLQREDLATRPVDPVSFELQPTGTWDAMPGGPALSMSGRLVGPTAPPTLLDEPWPETSPNGLPSVLDIEPEHLELAERPPRPPPAPEPTRRRWLPSVLTVAVLLLVLGGVVAALPHLKRQVDTLRGSGNPPPLLTVQSEPSGATVSVNGMVLGTTPLVIDNSFLRGDISVQVTLEGYTPWKGTFTGNEPGSLEVKLRRAKR